MKFCYNAGVNQGTKIRVKFLDFSLSHSLEYLTE